MLIRILKQSKDLIEGKAHAPGSEISRRSFLHRTGLGVGSVLMTPSLISLLKSSPAEAAAFACSVEPISTTYTQFCAAGGCGISRLAYAWGKDGGALVGASRSLGTRANDPVDSTSIPGIYLNGNDPFARALKSGGAVQANGVNSNQLFSAAVTNEIISRLSGSQIACAKNDDTDENPVNVMMLFGDKCGMRKGVLADVAGDAARDRSIDTLRNNFAVLRSGGSIQNLVNSASLQNNLVATSNMGGAMERALSSLTAEQKGKLAGQVGAEAFAKNLLSGISSAKGRFDPAVADAAFNPDNASNAAVFASRAPMTALSSKEKMYQALIDSACKQQVGAVNIVEGGYDYHNGGNNDANERHAFLARFVLIWAWVHIVRGVNGVLQIDTDGGIGWDTTDPAPNAMGDRGSAGQSLFIHVAGKAGAMPSFKRQGYYSALITNGGGESSSRDPLVGKSPQLSSVSCVLTYGLLTGILKTSDTSLTEFLNRINARGTVVAGGVSQLMELAMYGV